MPSYCVNRNAQTNGDHEVHDLAAGIAQKCLPAVSNQLSLGYHTNCQSAVAAAKSYYSQSNGCAYCAPACHTS